jgi:serine/threonine protein phosphatase PrpC
VNSKLFLDEDMTVPRVLPVAAGQACVFTRRRPGRDTANEDAAGVFAGDGDCAVLAVADGLGGLPAGSHAAALALQQLASQVTGKPCGDIQREAVLTGLEQANTAVLDTGQGGATTIAVAGIDHHTVRAYHAGDSMILITGQRGRIKYQSVPHSPVGYAEASGLLDAEGAMFHTERHLVSNMVGMTEMRIEMSPPIELAPRDTVLLASDGLFDNLYISEIIDLIRIGPLATAGARLLERCEQRMVQADGGQPNKPDDLTFVLYRRQPGDSRQ